MGAPWACSRWSCLRSGQLSFGSVRKNIARFSDEAGQQWADRAKLEHCYGREPGNLNRFRESRLFETGANLPALFATQSGRRLPPARPITMPIAANSIIWLRHQRDDVAPFASHPRLDRVD